MEANRTRPFGNYEEFWNFYLTQHSKPMTRKLHTVGLLIGLSLAFFALVSRQWGWLGAALVIGYGFAWYSHFVFEKNRPATFGHPLWSFLSEFRMVWQLLTGRLSP